MAKADCPSCGAPVRFRGAASIVAICEFCRSTLIKQGVKLEDIGKMPHPEIRSIVRRIDVASNGHAMVRPVPGFVWGDARRRVEAHAGRVHFAHSDASGFSLFEEAQYRGIAAAERVLARLGVRSETFL